MIDKLLFHRFPSAGLLQLSALCLTSLVVASIVSADLSSTTVKPPSGVDALRQTAFNSSAMFTFNQPGRSFVEYRHVWPSLKSAARVSVRLRFRTARSSGIMAVLSLVDERRRTTSSDVGGVLPTTLIRLHRGSLHVSVSTSRDQNDVTLAQSGIVIGRGLTTDHCCSFVNGHNKHHRHFLLHDLTSTLCLEKVPTFKLSMTLSNVN